MWEVILLSLSLQNTGIHLCELDIFNPYFIRPLEIFDIADYFPWLILLSSRAIFSSNFYVNVYTFLVGLFDIFIAVQYTGEPQACLVNIFLFSVFLDEWRAWHFQLSPTYPSRSHNSWSQLSWLLLIYHSNPISLTTCLHWYFS